MESTITEDDLDPTSARLVHGFREDAADAEPDLAVDGLSESLLTRLLSRLSVRSRA